MEFAAEMRRLMAARGISGCALARMIYCDKALISRLKNGRQAPSAETASRIDTALAAGGKLMAIARAETGPGRRSVLAGGLLASGLLAIGPEARELLTWSERHPAQIDAAGVGALADLLTAQRRADDVLGSGAMVRPVLSQLTVIEGLVRQARGPVRPELLYCAQQWGQFGGWICRAAQGLAAALATRPQDQRPWSYWMRPAFFRNEEGITCAYLAADPRWHARAVSLLEAADDGRPRVWAPAQNLTYAAFAHAQAGEVDQACAAAVQASGAVRRSGSAKTTLVLARVRTELQARYPGHPKVIELSDALA
jgi:transcriptional regulator with XRE-family HTH domain